MGRHHPSRHDDSQWPAAALTEGDSGEHTDHRERKPEPVSPDRSEDTDRSGDDG